MGWKASAVGLLWPEEGNGALLRKTISRLGLALPLLALAALVVVALGSGGEGGVSPAGFVETRSTFPGTEVQFILDEANPRWSILATSLNKDSAVVINRANPRWKAVADYFGRDAGFVLDEVNPRWRIVADYFAGESATGTVHHARSTGRDAPPGASVGHVAQGCTSPSFGPELRRGAAGHVAEPVVAGGVVENSDQGPSRDH